MNKKNNKQTTNDLTETNQGSGSELDTAPCSPSGFVSELEKYKDTEHIMIGVSGHETISIYDDQKNTLFLPEWKMDNSMIEIRDKVYELLEVIRKRVQDPNGTWIKVLEDHKQP
jgi:hypothetical protein